MALPLFLLVNKAKLVNGITCFASGVLIGGASAFLLYLPNQPIEEDVLTFAAGGALGGITFWIFWRLGARVEVSGPS